MWDSLLCLYAECLYTRRMADRKVVRNIRIDAAEWEAAKTAAERNGETVSDVVRRAIVDYTAANAAPKEQQ